MHGFFSLTLYPEYFFEEKKCGAKFQVSLKSEKKSALHWGGTSANGMSHLAQIFLRIRNHFGKKIK